MVFFQQKPNKLRFQYGYGFFSTPKYWGIWPYMAVFDCFFLIKLILSEYVYFLTGSVGVPIKCFSNMRWQVFSPTWWNLESDRSSYVQNAAPKISIGTHIPIFHGLKNGLPVGIRWALNWLAVFQEARKDLYDLHPKAEWVAPDFPGYKSNGR